MGSWFSLFPRSWGTSSLQLQGTAAGGGSETEQPRGAAAGEWGGICVLSKQQPQCPVAASSLINQPQPNVLGFPPPQGDWGWARVPRRVRWGWVGGGGGWLGFPSLGLCSFSSLLEALSSSCHGTALSWPRPFVRASATNHLRGSAGGAGGKRDESGLKKNVFWFSRDLPRARSAGGCWQRPCPPQLPSPSLTDVPDNRLRPRLPECPLFPPSPGPQPSLSASRQDPEVQPPAHPRSAAPHWGLRPLDLSLRLTLPLLSPCSPQGPRRPAHSLHHNNHSLGVA